MDLSQNKLTKSEWQSIETPVSDDEKKILKMIQSGYNDVTIRYNDHSSLLSVLKMQYNIENEKFLYTKYFEDEIRNLSFLWDLIKIPNVQKNVRPPKSIDLLRLSNMDKNIQRLYETTFEHVQLTLCKDILINIVEITTRQCFALYTLLQMKKSTIVHQNCFVREFIDHLLVLMEKEKPQIIEYIFHHMHEIVEKNAFLLQYQDKCLYEHQKQIFHLLKRNENEKMLILYTSATGSGKTITPLGLSVGKRIIYICAARHIGLQLAKSAISIGKCVAFAFGCETDNDIRLHYSSAVEFTKNKKSGSIAKVDNSDGSKVEIMICDISSYLISMYYMLLFNIESDIIMYWDEPTISLDQEVHPLHEIIEQTWQKNKISKVILSCATLPKQKDIIDTLDGFREKFDGATIHEISSFECNKSVSLLDSYGKMVLPHLLFPNYEDIERSANHCLENKSLLRYFDLKGVTDFINEIAPLYIKEQYKVMNYFTNISELTMDKVKIYYLKVLKQIQSSQWEEIYHLSMKKKDEIKRHIGIEFTTIDAHTLTDGPSIFIAEDVKKIGSFYIQHTKIPSCIYNEIMEKIGINNGIQKKMDQLMRTLDDTMGNEIDKEKKMKKEIFNPEVKRILDSIDVLRNTIKMIALTSKYIPNTKQHQELWVPNKQIIENAFIPFIDETTIREIMELELNDKVKILLLLGIGIFDIVNTNISYMEIMKRLATEQKLFIIIASSDYIYGTNYQLCHGILGKDLLHMTQQKTIQAMGRIGRGNIQQTYTVRFRDNVLLKSLFQPSLHNREAQNISKLFCYKTEAKEAKEEKEEKKTENRKK